MIKPDDPRQLAIDLLDRSPCAVQVAAVIADRKGRIISWGWNSMGSTGYGEHAEASAIRRSNKKRLRDAMIFVAARRNKSGNTVTAKPCGACQSLIDRWALYCVVYRDYGNLWKVD